MLLSSNILSSMLSNILYGASVIWYAYITHLGYRGNFLSFGIYHSEWSNFELLQALPFLGNTQVFVWYPIIGVSILLLLSTVLLMLGMHLNTTRIVMGFHYG